MKKNLFYLFALICSMSLFTACSDDDDDSKKNDEGSKVELPQLNANATGVFYTNATYPVTATGSKVENLHNLKKGEASTTNILYLVETGDASTDTAVKNGGIKK